MKRAGEIISVLFDERLMKKAQTYSRLFSHWETAVRKSGITAAADHSRIFELDRGILQVEADHPGWIQILQTKEHYILEDFRRNFPELNISGISIMLIRQKPAAGNNAEKAEAAAVDDEAAYVEPVYDETVISGYDAIKDDSFRESLKRLEKSISQKEKKIKK
jgi:hypothetical protein